jgi:hypothetical protein
LDQVITAYADEDAKIDLPIEPPPKELDLQPTKASAAR